MKLFISSSNPPSVVVRAVRLPPLARRLFLIAIDILLLPLSVWLSFWLRLAHPFHPSFLSFGLWLFPAVLLLGIPLYALTGQYKGLTRYVGSRALYNLAARNSVLIILLVFTGVILQLPMPPRSSWILLWFLLTFFTGSVRFALRDSLLSLRSLQQGQTSRVAIYGSGEAGAQLAAVSCSRPVRILDPSSWLFRPLNLICSKSVLCVFNTFLTVSYIFICVSFSFESSQLCLTLL